MCVAVVQVWGVGVLMNHSLMRVDVSVRAEDHVARFMSVVMVQVVMLMHVFMGYLLMEMGVTVLF